METLLIVFLLAVLALIIIYFYYDRYRKVKKGKDPQTYIEGLRALLEGKDELAFARFRDVVSEDSSNIDAYIRIGNILRKYDKADKALQVHKDLTLRHGLESVQKIAILDAVAEDYMKLKDFQAARNALVEAIKLDGSDRRLNKKLTKVLLKLEDWDAAFDIRQKLSKLSPEDKGDGELAIYKFFQGKRLFDNKKYHDARLVFKEAININAGCVPAYIWIGDSYVAENRLEDAVAVWNNMIKAVPDESVLVLERLEKALFELGKFGAISDICRDILSASTDNIDARLTLAEYHNKKGEYSLAVEHLRVAMENHPDSFRPVLNLARLYLITDDKEKLKTLLDSISLRRESIEMGFRCRICDYKSEKKIWLCPSCQAPDSFIR